MITRCLILVAVANCAAGSVLAVVVPPSGVGPPSGVVPGAPASPVAPVLPVAPVAPVLPVAPVAPVLPVAPVAPVAPVFPVAPGSPAGPLLLQCAQAAATASVRVEKRSDDSKTRLRLRIDGA